jgi:hypothetical protein
VDRHKHPGPRFPHYICVPVHSQDLGFNTTFLCLSTARTWISQVLAVDRHKHLVWKSRSWLWIGTKMYCGNPGPGCGQTQKCSVPQTGPGFPHYMFVPVHSQDLDFHTTLLCLSTARTWISTLNVCACPQPGPGLQTQKCSVEIQVLAVDRHKNVVWKSRSWLWTGTKM